MSETFSTRQAMFKRIKQGWSQPAGESDDNVAIQVPDDTLGLNFLTDEHAEADVDIVAVHGLGGDAYSTWTASNGKLWLRDFLPDELQNATSNAPKKARIMTFGYDAGLFTRATTERSFAFAENLLNELRDARAGEPARSRPLIFIGHSLGGIVIKKALIIAQSNIDSYGELLLSVVHLCFFGTPHQGTGSGMGFLQRLGDAVLPTKDGCVIRELKLWSHNVLETNTLFTGMAQGFTITTVYEKCDYKTIRVVDEGSARLNKPKETVIGLERHHINICKFGSLTESSYRTVSRRLRTEISTIGSAEQIARQVEEQNVRQRIDNLLPPLNPPGN